MKSFDSLFQPLDHLFEDDFLLSEQGQFNMCQLDKLQEQTQALKLMNKRNLNNLNQFVLRLNRPSMIDVLIKYNKQREFYLNLDVVNKKWAS